jgi:hypothetical protein
VNNECEQPLPPAIEEILMSYPDALLDLRRQLYSSIHTDSLTPCIDRVIWSIKDTLTAMLAKTNAELRKAEELGDTDLSERYERRRKALSLAGSDGYGMRDVKALLALCTEAA